MIPTNDGLQHDFELENQPTKTFKLNLDKNRIVGKIDEIEALKQAIFLILSCERYEHIIYSWNYGFESNDLIGKPIDFVMSEVKRRILEALLQDERITGVDSFEFNRNKKKLHVTFTVHSIYGDFTEETAVNHQND
ncbi:DUF2634 domain-containing protein [Paenibacillus lentus]|uniref:DUF2634 domain-containing protein n=1 Tax=Paenibacillus lentus TaxID=1338368 RepID=A0A3Q8S738_9BACL|nr:DUF2634 domain-containing protein [Paenibacillus lentus]AZK48786.1 DUF2634 domain-containing protein [Paenibacillus lentus]